MSSSLLSSTLEKGECQHCNIGQNIPTDVLILAPICYLTLIQYSRFLYVFKAISFHHTIKQLQQSYQVHLDFAGIRLTVTTFFFISFQFQFLSGFESSPFTVFSEVTEELLDSMKRQISPFTLSKISHMQEINYH